MIKQNIPPIPRNYRQGGCLKAVWLVYLNEIQLHKITYVHIVTTQFLNVEKWKS
jgi:hypothetical protein